MVYLRRLSASEISVSSRRLERGSCFTEQYTRGNCDAARFSVSEIAAVLAGPQAHAVHLIDATPARQEISEPIDLGATGGTAWSVEREGVSWIVGVPASGDSMSYLAPASAALHVFLPYPSEGRSSIRVQSIKAGETCRVTIGGNVGVEIGGTPGMFAVDSACKVSDRGAGGNT